MIFSGLLVLALCSLGYALSFAPPFRGRPVASDLSCMLEDSPFAKLKKLNDSCNSSLDCFNGGGPVICNAQKICECGPGFYAVKQSASRQFPFIQVIDPDLADSDQYICRPLPSLYQPCSTQCAPPLQCGGGDDNFGPETGRPNRRRTTTTPRTTTITGATMTTESSTTPGISSTSESVSGTTSTQQTLVGNDLEISRDDVLWGGRPWGGRSDKICQCLPPYKVITFQCQLECNDTEFYANGECHKKCTENEVMLDNFECKPRVALGDSCQGDEQCTAAFSGCVDGKCSCRAGFATDSNGKGCSVQVAHCEYGDPLRASGGTNGSGLASCVFNGPQIFPFSGSEILNLNGVDQSFSWTRVITVSSGNIQDSPAPDDENGCPQDHYCQPYENPTTRPSTPGFCCPKQKPRCPVGEPHATANCSVQFGAFANGNQHGGFGNAGEECPAKTHFCYQRLGAAGATCCPRACASGLVLTDGGQCMPMMDIGLKCQTSEQCSGGSLCTNGLCTCPNNTELVNVRGSQKFCNALCNPVTEVNFNNKCYSRKNLGDQCRGQEFRCPVTGFCGRNGTCQCPCGTAKVNDTFCAPPPSCPRLTGPNTVDSGFGDGDDFSSLLGAFGGSGANRGRGRGGQGGQGRGRGRGNNGRGGGNDGGRSTPSQTPSTRQTAQQLYDNATFCQLENVKAPSDRALGQCPDGQVCMVYLEDMGICCQKPDPFCPNGARPQNPCNPFNTDDDSCDDNSSCFTYAAVASKNSTDGHVCCPRRGFGQPNRGDNDFPFSPFHN